MAKPRMVYPHSVRYRRHICSQSWGELFDRRRSWVESLRCVRGRSVQNHALHVEELCEISRSLFDSSIVASRLGRECKCPRASTLRATAVLRKGETQAATCLREQATGRVSEKSHRFRFKSARTKQNQTTTSLRKK